MAVLLVVGLAVADVVTYSSLRSFLYGRLDAQIDAAQSQAARYLLVRAPSHGHPASDDGPRRHGSSPDVYVLVLGHDGKVVSRRPSGSPDRPDPQPVIRRRCVRLAVPGRTFGRAPRAVYRPSPTAFDMAGPRRSGAHYRAQAVDVPQGVLVIAISLNSTTDTLASLLRVELVASLAVLVALCILALWTVRRGLRPLETWPRPPGPSRRATSPGGWRPTTSRPRSAVWGVALNAMLGQIEAAFAEKSASEARLRQFVADASHELRTPLTSIRGYTELLRKGAFADEESRQRALPRVEHEAGRMGGLVDDLLLLARLDQGRPLEQVPVDLRRVGADAVDDARAVDPGRPVDLVAAGPVVGAGRPRPPGPGGPQPRAQRPRPHPAGHAGPGRGGRAEHGMGVLRVSDEGPGLEPAPSGRGCSTASTGATPSRTGQGTGLGLSIVRAIAEALGGSTPRWPRSPGEGAVFTVAIPLRQPDTVPAMDAGPPGPRRRRGVPSTPADASARPD